MPSVTPSKSFRILSKLTNTISIFFLSRFISAQCFLSSAINGFVMLHYNNNKMHLHYQPQTITAEHYIMLKLMILRLRNYFGSQQIWCQDLEGFFLVLGFIFSELGSIQVLLNPWSFIILQLIQNIDNNLICSGMHYLKQGSFPQCSECHLTQELAECDIQQKTQCGLIICRICREKHGAKICMRQGCKKLYKKHNFRKNFSQKYKKQLSIKFDNEVRVRSQWQQYVKKDQIDIDMVHILSSLSSQNRQTYNNHIKSQVDRLINEIRNSRNTVESQMEGRKLPIHIQTKINEKTDEYDGSFACGYIKDSYRKGVSQILQCFSNF